MARGFCRMAHVIKSFLERFEMKSVLAGLAASLLSFPALALADPLPDGLYAGPGGGGDLRMRVTGRSATLEVSAVRCVGRVSGSFRDAGPDAWLFSGPADGGRACEISIRRQPGGAMQITEQGGCMFWHGAACDF